MPGRRRTGSFRATPIILLTLGAWLSPGLATRAHAQDTLRTVSATLLRRLGEAVAGQTVAGNVWVVANYEYPNEVRGVVTTRDAALRAAAALGSSWGTFGPYNVPIPLPGGGGVLPGCVHDGMASIFRPMICPNPIVPIPWADVDSITVTMHVGGRTLTNTLPLGSDAVFFTLPALDKFLFPYYVNVLGVAEAARMRQQVVDRIR